MLRLASTATVFTHAVRTIASPKIRSLNFSTAVTESPTVSDGRFSTCSGSRKVVEALKSEIESHELALMKSRGVPANIPFTIWDDTGYMHIMMNRDLGEEKIDVTVHPIHYSWKDDYKYNDDLSVEEKKKEKEKEKEAKKSVYINVSIIKEKKGTLDVGAHASADEIVLDRVSFSDPNSSTDLVRYMVYKEGEVQDALREFVKSRGIEKSNFGFLRNYMVEKARTWDSMWTPVRKPARTHNLKILKKFFEDW